MSRKIVPIIMVCAIGLAAIAWFFAGRQHHDASPSAPQLPQSAAPAGGKQATPAGVPVLMYHSIGDEKDNDAVIARERFAEQMQFLHRQGFQPISLAELYNYVQGKGGLPAKPVVLTFDDGYRDLYEVAFPILKQYGFKSAAFIPATVAGTRLTWPELEEMKAAGMEIVSHSYNHRDLGTMSAAQQAEEIVKSKELLDSLLKQDTRYFCYPNGSYNQETLHILKSRGFLLAVTIEPGWAKQGDDPLTLRRVWIGNSVDLAHFEERLTRPDYSVL